MENTKPLLCDHETGTCIVPGETSAISILQESSIAEQQTKPVHIIYFTDPICSACWGIEPQLRKLKFEYGKYFNMEYRMGGLLPSWQGFNSGGLARPSDVAGHWDEASAHYEMPIDGNVWLEDPLSSSYPASIAFIAAKMQSAHKAEKYLRRIKEMVFTEKKNTAKWEHLRQAAIETGLDPIAFKNDFEGPANEWFQADLDFARSRGVRAFPTLFLENTAGARKIITGIKPYEHFEKIIFDLHPSAEKDITGNSSNIFSHYPALTTKEFSIITNQSMEVSHGFLEKLSDKNIVQQFSGRNGSIWKAKTNIS